MGIIPGGGGTQRLARIIGVGRAKELIFTGDQIDAQEAYRLGLANHVVPRDELMETCRALGKKIASRASYAVFLAKTAINSSQEIDLKNGAEREKDLLGLAFATRDKQEGMEAFLARRPRVSWILNGQKKSCPIWNPLRIKDFLKNFGPIPRDRSLFCEW